MNGGGAGFCALDCPRHIRTPDYRPVASLPSSPTPDGSNFGDRLGPLVVRAVSGLDSFPLLDGGRYDAGVTGAPGSSFRSNATFFREHGGGRTGVLLLALGSILGDALPAAVGPGGAARAVVWGTGTHRCPQPGAWDRVAVAATRGPLTAACVARAARPEAAAPPPGGWAAAAFGGRGGAGRAEPVYGDPGLLSPLVWPACGRACEPRCAVCALFHQNDAAAARKAIEGVARGETAGVAPDDFCTLGPNGARRPPAEVGHVRSPRNLPLHTNH